MFGLIVDLVLIRLRKFLPAKDRTAFVLFITLYLGIYVLVFNVLDKIGYFGCLLVLDLLAYHLRREDLELLRLRSNYKAVLFVEYFVYFLPLFLVYMLNGDYFVLFGLAFILVLPFIDKKKHKVCKLPFNLLAPIWHVYSRKYHSYVFILLSIFVLIMGSVSENENLVLASLFSSLLFPLLIYMEEDQNAVVPFSYHRGRQFINHQVYVYWQNLFIFNTLFIVLFMGITQSISLSLLLFGVYLVSACFVVCKYAIANTLLRGLCVCFIAVGVGYGSLLLIPLVYFRSIQNIKKIQC